MKTKLSIVVPVLHETEVINPFIEHIHKVGEREDYEIIVVDGSPEKNTIDAIKDRNVIKITSPKSRARQMNAGAAVARGEILLFLHVDTKLPLNAFKKIREVLENSRYVGGAFDLELDTLRRSLRFIAWTARIRVRLTQIPYGDQAIFIRKDYFDTLGGYRNFPLMEDVELMERIKKSRRKICIIKETVRSSPRKWLKEGIFYTTFRNHIIRILYSLGVSPDKLVKLYYKDYNR
ncbi:MAG: TIGR04283 family arsenosugar biosynthesis glycosyltransferase [Nitrospirota bacterium]|nr:TIGR04283 family arsenosugar biosynthesis glycosyltransferase [Nitrospirota bacterium]MDH5767474.1 TIGR04283 family arsenosugar biosynthesis glycosyltransferase [Nitrospirota bacterium]